VQDRTRRFDAQDVVGDRRGPVDVLRVEPTRAVLHRSVAASGDGPGCVTIV